ncbi:MAG: glycosyltransferase family 4 protein [Chitinophagales bacterium]
MKKVCAVHLLNDYSGSPLVFRQAIEALIENQFEVDVFTSANKCGFLSNIPNASYKYFNYTWSKNKYLTLFYYIFTQAVIFFRLFFSLKKGTIVYINTVLPFGAALAGYFRCCKVIYHIHETSIKPYALKKILFRIAKQTASDVLYVSKFVHQEEKVSDVNTHVIYNCLSDSFLEKVIRNENARENKTILMLCSLKLYKGIYEFVKLARELQSYKFQLVLNADMNAIQMYFKDTQIPLNLEIYPTTEDAHKFYTNASLVVNLSKPKLWRETFGMTILEAMSFGLPVIVPPVGGVTELVKNGRNGYYCDSSNITQLKEYIISILDDPSLYESMSYEAYTLSTHFSAISFKKQLLSVFNVVSQVHSIQLNTKGI